MRPMALSIAALLLAAPVLGATETDPAEETVPDVTPSVVAPAEAPPPAQLHLQEVALQESRAAADADAAAQLGPRGSFWWMVGVIVVAGIILAVVL